MSDPFPAVVEATASGETAELFADIRATVNRVLAGETLSFETRHRDAAVLTFVVTLSGVTVARVGSPLWGVVAGSAAIGCAAFTAARSPPVTMNEPAGKSTPSAENAFSAIFIATFFVA